MAIIIRTLCWALIFIIRLRFPPVHPSQITCYMQTISDLLEQLVASLLASSTLLQDDNNLFQTCQQLGISNVNTSC
jgi:hypothetical protein